MYCHCSHYVNEETEKLSRLPKGVGFGHRLSDSRALALAITLRRAEGEGRCRLERWKHQMPCAWSKGKASSFNR